MEKQNNLLIKNVKLYFDTSITQNIFIKNGKIEALNIDPQNIKEQYEVYDALSAVLLPGMIDVHTHTRDPGLTQKEDFYTASKACAHGGVTTLIDMPNTVPPTTTLKALDEKRHIALDKCFVNFGFHFGSSALNNVEEIRGVQNVASIKVYLNETTGNLFIEDDELLLSIFKAAPHTLSFHAEGPELMQKCFDLAKKTSKNIYFCHVALQSELELLLKLKQEIKEKAYPFNLYIEVSPHHLFFSMEDLVAENEYLLQMKPPLKSLKDKNALMEALQKGLIDTIGTDHAPHLLEEKVSKITYGVPGIEACLPFLLDCVNRFQLTLEQVVKLYSENPAQIFRIQNKGVLTKGADADFVLVDLNQETILNKSNIVSRCGWSLFEGKPLKGKVLETWVKGVKVYSSENESYNEKYKMKEVSFG